MTPENDAPVAARRTDAEWEAWAQVRRAAIDEHIRLAWEALGKPSKRKAREIETEQ